MSPDTPASRSRRIKEKARELGFLECGITRAGHLNEDAPRLKHWLKEGYHGEMHYMEKHYEKRLDPALLVEGALSVILVLQNYHTLETPSDPAAPRISRYAFGKDYHRIVKKKLKTLLAFIQEEMGPANGRCFVDSAPLLERALARNAGLGWIGKHSLLLNRRNGSWFFIGSIVTDLELRHDTPVREYCGDCTRCIDACPTGAILSDRIVDSRRCISCLTVEYKGKALPPEFRGRMENYVFGCDICQEVCPWNRNAHPHDEPRLNPLPGLLMLSREEWLGLDEDRYNRLFEGSAVKRAGYRSLKRNIEFLGEG